MRNWLIRKLGGYTPDEVLTEAVADLYNTISENDILREENGKWMVGDKEIDEATKKMLISEAKSVLNMKLWKYLNYDIKYLANERMYLKSENAQDLIFGKSWTWILNAMETRLKGVSKGIGELGGADKEKIQKQRQTIAKLLRRI